MNLIERMSDLRHCYILTPSGSLGVYREDGSFHVEGELTQALSAPIAAFLAQYRQSHDTRAYRIGLVHTDHSERPWHSQTLALADEVLRRLYPMVDVRQGRLTTFQRSNREKSLYRGMELLLGYRDQSAPMVPYYFPVFVYRSTTLDHYLPGLERTRRETDTQTPVVEIIDLFAATPFAQRNEPLIEKGLTTLQKRLIKPERRSAPNLFLIDDVRQSSYAWKENTHIPVDPYTDVEERAIAEITGRFSTSGIRDWNYTQWLESHCAPQTSKRLNHLLGTNDYRYREAEALRVFERLADFDREALRIIAALNPVFRVPAGTRLLDWGSRDNWNLYLLSGDLELKADEEKSRLLAGGSASARKPVAFLKPRLFSVSTHTQVEFLWLYEPMVDVVARLQGRSTGVRTKYLAASRS